MKEKPTLHVTTRSEWRQWLEENHQSQKVIWLIYHKKHTGKPRIPYDDAVEEALCYGWIDSTVNRIDEDRYMQQFTPRNKKSVWSVLNISRVKKLIQNGTMTGAGMEKIPPEILKPGYQPDHQLTRRADTLPENLEKMIRPNKKAWENFQKLPPSHKRHYCGWILSAKREETRLRRLKEVVSLMSQGKKLGMK